MVPLPPSGEPLGFAIIGTGLIAHFHAEALTRVPGAKLVAAYSRSPERTRDFAAQHGCQAAPSLESLVRDPAIQVACITTPSGAHAEAAIPFLEAGKAVLCEKPLEITVRAVDQILAAEQRGGGLLACVFQNRFGRGAQQLKSALEAGRFGRLTLCSAYVKWWRDLDYYSGSSWKGTWQLDGGGALMNQAIHAVDLLQWLAGLPIEVKALRGTLAHPGVEAEDTLVAALRFPGGALGVIEAATSAYPGDDLRLEICGDQGSATLQQDRITRWQFATPLPGDPEILAPPTTPAIGGGASHPAAISTLR